MPRVTLAAAVLGTMSLAACTVPPPTGPSVMALPAQGKTFERFQQDDAACRQYASEQIGYGSPAQASNESAVNSAIVETALGAAAGAALGAAAGNAGIGAAAGAGTGLLVGSAAGTGASQASAVALQRRYDVAYLQCMSAKGESVPTAQSPYPYYPYAPYYPPYAPY